MTLTLPHFSRDDAGRDREDAGRDRGHVTDAGHVTGRVTVTCAAASENASDEVQPPTPYTTLTGNKFFPF